MDMTSMLRVREVSEDAFGVWWGRRLYILFVPVLLLASVFVVLAANFHWVVKAWPFTGGPPKATPIFLLILGCTMVGLSFALAILALLAPRQDRPDVGPRPEEGAEAAAAPIDAKTENDPVLLRVAAGMALEAIEGSKGEQLLNGLTTSAEGRLNFFIFEMRERGLKHYGRKLDASEATPIPPDELEILSSVFGENTLKVPFEDEPRYVDVAVNGHDLQDYLGQLKKRFA